MHYVKSTSLQTDEHNSREILKSHREPRKPAAEVGHTFLQQANSPVLFSLVGSIHGLHVTYTILTDQSHALFLVSSLRTLVLSCEPAHIQTGLNLMPDTF